MKSKLIGNDKAVQMVEAYLNGSTYAPLLISGQKGLGQELLVMEIAAELLKTSVPEKHGNFFALRAEKGSIRVEDVEELLDRSRISAHSGTKKVFGIFGIGSMTEQAQNRLLKLLEDRSDTNVVLMTKNEGIVLDTIASRSESIRLRPVCKERMLEYLNELGAGEDSAIYEAILRGCPYRYQAVAEKISVFREIYQKQLKVSEKQSFLYLFHEVKEKDKESFYEKDRGILFELLRMEFSIFEKLLLWKQGGIDELPDRDYQNFDQLYDLEDVFRILKMLLKQRRKLNAGRYTRNDFVAMLRELCC